MIYLIITTSIINRFGVNTTNETQRRTEYINSIQKTLDLLPVEIKPIIVENNGLRKTFLDNFEKHNIKIPVHYTDNNNIQYYHKGVNELNDIQSVIKHFNIKDDDYIIKLTGRYFPINSNFFDFVINHHNEYEAFVKFFNVCTLQYMDYDCVLGLYAIRCKHLKQVSFNDTYKSPEVNFATFVKNLSGNVFEIDRLDLRCCFNDEMRKLVV